MEVAEAEKRDGSKPPPPSCKRSTTPRSKPANTPVIKAWPSASPTRALCGSKPEEKITRLQDELGKVPAEAKPLLETVLGHWYRSIFGKTAIVSCSAPRQPNRLGKTSPRGPARLYPEIDLHFTNALADGRLKTILTRDFADLLTKPTLPENYRSTLYDFIAHEALAFGTSASSPLPRMRRNQGDRSGA